MPLKKIAILLNGDIRNDYRVIKTVQSLSKILEVHLFYINTSGFDSSHMFSSNVQLHPCKHDVSLTIKILRHSFFCREFIFLVQTVLKTKIKFEYVWANDLPTLLPAFKLSKKLSSTLIYDSHEIYIETLNQFFPQTAKLPKKIIFKILLSIMTSHGNYVEKKRIRNVDIFITVNDSLLSYFHKKYNFSHGTVIMNLPYLENSAIKKIDFRKLNNWSIDDVVLLYQGALNSGRGLFILLESMTKLPHQFKLIIIGEGVLKQALLNFVSNNELTERVAFIDIVPITELRNYTASADIGINLLESFNLSKKLASPNKLFEYIHAEIPILASDTIENKKILDQYKVGKLTSNDPEEIARKIIEFNVENVENYSQKCHIAKQKLNWQIQEKSMLELFKPGNLISAQKVTNI